MANHVARTSRAPVVLGWLVLGALIPVLFLASTTVAGWMNRSSGGQFTLVSAGAGSPGAGSGAAAPVLAERSQPPGVSRSQVRQPSTSAWTDPESQALSLMNAERAAHGCGQLTADVRLQRAAVGHVRDLVARHFFDHTNPDGLRPWERAAAQGFHGRTAENIAVGYPDAAAVMQGWMSSAGHRANILNCQYTVVGIGYDPGTVQSPWAPGAWVQDFGAA